LTKYDEDSSLCISHGDFGCMVSQKTLERTKVLDLV